MEPKGLFEFIEGLRNKGESLESIKEKAWADYGMQCAVLVMDSSGFTKITQKYGIVSFLTCLVEARRIIADVFKPYNNLSFRAEADNIYAEFKKPSDAYQAALNANRVVAADKHLSVGRIKYHICIGIGYGRVLNAGHEGVYGDEMNLASKLGEDIAESGEILLTPSAFQNLDDTYQIHFSKRKTQVSGVDVDYYHSDGSVLTASGS